MGSKSARRAVGMGARAVGRFAGRGSEATSKGSKGANQGSRDASMIVNAIDAPSGTQTSQGSQYAAQ